MDGAYSGRGEQKPLEGRKIAFLVAPEGVEQVELTEPWAAVERAGGRPVLIVGSDDKAVQGFNHLDKVVDASGRGC